MVYPDQNPQRGASRILTRSEVLDLFQISAPTLREWQRKKLIEGIKLSGRVYFLQDDIYALFNSKNSQDAK